MTDTNLFTPGQISTDHTQVLAENLAPLFPRDAPEMYIETRREDGQDTSLRTHKYQLSFCIEWYQREKIFKIKYLTGRGLLKFNEWRTKFLDSSNTLRTNMHTLRWVLRKCLGMEASHPSLPEKLPIPSVPKDQRLRDDILPAQRGADILPYLDTYHYATRDHVILVLLAEARFRTCTLLSLDIQDYRTPLRGTTAGRLSKTFIRQACSRGTRPCVIRAGCPHGREAPEFDDCEARKSSKASKCPNERSLPAIRRGYISNEFDQAFRGQSLTTGVTRARGPQSVDYDPLDKDARPEIRQKIQKQGYQNQRAVPHRRDQDDD